VGASLPPWIFSVDPWVLVVVFLADNVLNLTSGRTWDAFVFARAFLFLSTLAGVVAWWTPR
jgi:hypothetical protein